MKTRLVSAILSLTLLSISLHANQHYLLPEQYSDLMHTLTQKIKRAHHITVITQGLESLSLSKSIENALLAKAAFHLITTDLSTAAYYAKYKNSTVRVPTSPHLAERFRVNVLMIDDSEVCISTLPFVQDDLRSKIGMVICSTNPEEIGFSQNISKRYSERFEPYNK